jgi:hypothetical protein
MHETLKEISYVRVAVIMVALLAMILGPVSGSAAARVVQGTAAVALAAAVQSDCDHGLHTEAATHGSDHDHCDDGFGTCLDTSGCRHNACLTGSPIPGALDPVPDVVSLAVRLADWDRPDGRDVAPLLDPPRSRV